MKLRLCVIIGIMALLVGCTSKDSAGPTDAEQANEVQTSEFQEKPGNIEIMELTLEAVVEAVDYDTRQLTLKDAQGNSVTIEVDEQVQNLPQVEVGDTLEIQYIETVAMQAFAADEAEPGAAAVVAGARAEAGEKPGAVAVAETAVVVTIEAIDKETQAVTLKNKEGESWTVKARNPENLEKVVVGDKVLIVHTQAIGIGIIEK